MIRSRLSAAPHRLMRAACLLLLLVWMPAGSALADGMPMMLADNPAPLVASEGETAVEFTIEVAKSPAERERGLMFRKSMGDRHGMLFVFEKTQELAFWMKNTPMPLDIIFIGEDGRVRAVLEGKPFSTDAVSPGEPARFVLELKAGTAQKVGIRSGTMMHHPLIDKVAAGH